MNADSGAPEQPREDTRRVAFGSVTGFLALGFGSGISPVAPGTVGSLAAIPIAVPLLQLHPVLFWPAWLVLFVGGCHVCGSASHRMGRADPGAIVWDEMVAMWLVLALLPAQAVWWLAGFALFRVLDIAKPWPIRSLERRFRGGFGIMLDDLVAAVLTIAILQAAIALFAVSVSAQSV